MSNVIAREFNSVFTIDTSKLSRLLNVVDERFKGLTENVFKNFEVTTKKGRKFHTSNIDEIFGHDNSVNNPIISLEIVFKDKKEEPENFCIIHYDKVDSFIVVKVQSNDPRKGNDLFAEVEEQIERSLTKNLIYSIKKDGPREFYMTMAALFFALAVFSTVFSFPSNKNPKTTDYLSDEDVSYLLKSSSDLDTEASKITFLYEYQVRKLKNLQPKDKNTVEILLKQKIFNIKVLFLVLPFIVVFVGLFYIVWRTYIGSVFLWGDYKEFYSALLERRKFVWNAVIVALLIGVVANLFVFGFSHYL